METLGSLSRDRFLESAIANPGAHQVDVAPFFSFVVERMSSAPHVVYVPSDEEWRHTMPPWAQGRREEIIQNVKRRLGMQKV